MDYYLRFVETYPDVAALAAAHEDDVLKMWQGLGYYSRARNLLKAAQQVVERNQHDHRPISYFPTRYDELLTLKGIGRYTAAAIASFSSDEPVAVVDGNVYRVLSRVFDIDTPIDTTRGAREYQALADEMLDTTAAARHNQAMMEFGALQCLPTSPHCEDCPIADHCLALANHTVAERPVKQGAVKVKERQLIYIIYIYKDKLWVHQRGAGDIWQGLWEYYLCPEAKTVSETMAACEEAVQAICIHQCKHQLTHQTLNAEFWVVMLREEIADPASHPLIKALPADYQMISWSDWQQKAVPRLIDMANKKLSAWF